MKNTSTRRGFTQQVSLLHLREKVAGGRMRGNLAAFTLIELVIAVLIIGILAAVAIPMYQRAVYKSRFSKLMLPAKTLASANEAFFLGNGEYATTVAALDVGGNTASLPDGSSVQLNDDEAVSFVQIANAEVPNARYVVYQQKSANFADATMCEALDTDDRATWLCDKGLNGTRVEDAEGNSGLEAGWSAYLLTGNAGANEHFTVLRTCDGEAPSQTTNCPQGCGSVTMTAECNTRTGEWEEIPEADLSFCQNKPADRTTSCGTGYTGNKTKKAVCTNGNWSVPSAWDSSECKKTYTSACETYFTDRSDCSNASFTQNRCTASQNHSGCNNNTYSGTASCMNNNADGCNDSEFSGSSHCVSDSGGIPAKVGCTGNTFSGSSYCQGTGKSNLSIVGGGACSNNVFNAGTYCIANGGYNPCSEGNTFNAGSYCGQSAYDSNGCNSNTFNAGSYCNGAGSNMCKNNTYKAGSYCKSSSAGNCTGTYEPGSWCEGSYCPAGSPKKGGGTW